MALRWFLSCRFFGRVLPSRAAQWNARSALALCRCAASHATRKTKITKSGRQLPDFAAGAIELENPMASGESKDFFFEDIFEAGDGSGDGFAYDEPEHQRQAEPEIESKPVPVEDQDLQNANLLTLTKDEFIWAVGRAATLKLPPESRVWKDLPHAVLALGGPSEFTPSEVCRLLQALAYAPTEAPIDKKLLQRLFKIFALRAKEFSDERLMRIMYAYGKLSSKRGLSFPRFMDFATSEVVERAAALRSWRKVRILESVGSLPEAGPEFKTLLVAQIMKVGTQQLDAECFAKFVPMIVDTKYHERPGAVERINAVYKRKLKHVRFSNPELILASGMPLFLFDLMKTSVLTRWLDRLSRLHVPLTAGATVQTGLLFVDGTKQQDWLKPADSARASKNLETLKLVDFVLRHERPSSLEVLTPQGLQLLAKARATTLQPPDDHDMPELPHVYAGLSKLFRKLGVLLHPTTCGPYLLELADPLGQLVVEWDSSWKLYPPWRQDRHREFVQRKHFHLRAEGWKVIVIPLDTFTDLPSKEKLDFLDRFCNDQKLDHLRVGKVPEAGSGT